MITGNTIEALRAAEAFTDDRRKLLVLGHPHALDRLQREGANFWREVPSCFRPNSATAQRIVGSFNGVPCAADRQLAADRLLIMLGERQLAAVKWEV